MTWLTQAQDDLGALLTGTILLVRRGLLAAIVSLVLGAVFLGLIFLSSLAGLYGFLAVAVGLISVVPLLYTGPLAAFAIALDRKPRIKETLGVALRRLPALYVIGAPGALLGLGLVGIASVAAAIPRIASASGSPPGQTSEVANIILFGLFGLIALVAVLRMWARYFLFPAAIAAADRVGFIAAYERSSLVAAKHRFVFAAATALPLVFVVAAIPDQASQNVAHEVLDPHGVMLLRILVGVAAACASLLACAALSVAAYGLASGRLDASALEPHDSGPES